MNRTKIEWCNYTINPIKGLCKHNCFYCYAQKMYKRFKWNEEVRLDMNELKKVATIKEPSKIFICSTHDLFGKWIPDKWIFNIVTELQRYGQHTFILLTKNAKRYQHFTFRENFWLGETITKWHDPIHGVSPFVLNHKNIRFVSLEPLFNDIFLNEKHPFDWIIVGAMTGQGSKKFSPKKEWIKNILNQAKKNKIPVFMKNNLQPYYKGILRQEFPKIPSVPIKSPRNALERSIV